MKTIRTNVKRLSEKQRQAYQKESSATVHEAMGRKGAVDSRIHSICRGMKVCGNALTVECHTGDNVMLVKAINMAKQGDVIVAKMGLASAIGPFGEVLATECMEKELAGLVVDSSVRDTKELIEMGFPVFSAGIGISGTAKATLGTINHDIAFGGVIIRPGDLILGDDDGVVVVPYEDVDEVISAVEKRTEKEAEYMERVRNGESLFDIYGYQNILDRLHCTVEGE